MSSISPDCSSKILADQHCTNDCINSVDDLRRERTVAYSKEVSDETTGFTAIQQFYENQCIFITGGTGFLGKILIEKLLRCCPGIAKIFVLVRAKKDSDVGKRLKDLLEDPVFERVRSDFADKVQAIAGDCSSQNLGLGDGDAELLKAKVSVVFHAAATVRFDEKLPRAVAVNLRSTASVVELCKAMTKLKSFVHLSTAYANCFVPDIEEKFYNYPINHRQLLLLVDSLAEQVVEAMTPRLMRTWPNTYTFTKALAENLIRAECATLPVGIFRPGIVTPSSREPAPGWVDNYNGIVSAAALIAGGVVRTVRCDPGGVVNLVPVDLTINALVASARDLTLRTCGKADDLPIYNFASVNDAPITWRAIGRNVVKYANIYPLRSALWCAVLLTTRNALAHYLCVLLLHLIPGCLMDLGIRVVGGKPRMLKTYLKIHRMDRAIRHFRMNSWRFDDDNVRRMWGRLDARDRRLFRFSMLGFDWDGYFADCVKGIRVFLLRDDLTTLEASRSKCKRFIAIHRLMIASLVGFAFWLLWSVSSALL